MMTIFLVDLTIQLSGNILPILKLNTAYYSDARPDNRRYSFIPALAFRLVSYDNLFADGLDSGQARNSAAGKHYGYRP